MTKRKIAVGYVVQGWVCLCEGEPWEWSAVLPKPLKTVGAATELALRTLADRSRYNTAIEPSNPRVRVIRRDADGSETTVSEHSAEPFAFTA